MVIQSWSDTVAEVLQDIWTRILDFIPELLGALVILIIGWIVADLLAWVVDRVIRLVRLPDLFKSARVEDLVKRSGAQLDTTGLIAALVRWVLILVAFIAAADTLNMQSVEQFLNRVLGYIDNVVAAGAILLIGAIFAHFMAGVIKGAISAAKLSFVEMVGNIVKYAILVFSVLAALSELGIAERFLETLFVGIVAFVAIAGGLSFGLGGQHVAKQWLEKLKKELEA